MQGYINRLFGWGHQPKKTSEEIKKRPAMIIESGTVEIADELTEKFGPPEHPFDETLYNKRMELLKYLVENNEANAVAGEINALLTALMEQLQVKVYEPPDVIEYELQGPYEKDGE